ncbi:YihY/virulence factor BrkB family protein [Halodesulfurarchaeum sp. HSR-GB]|uniref:YihY/virulence factor BrkB family protein n=1 Tax=Halodesulfurarchaeum sp. HSR-GB TaxID=3074077 RepID=UPI0028582180|nr:YihY/virulence factor BrkB family protein [Halodesulfurarchaeum sp. HSR-GB]MDR5656325.1 YihY/virulence factor BrkB family protein [Halodesulfurarchaeum sp. HSR-GB]
MDRSVLWTVPIAVVREVQRSQATFLAAAIAYYGFVSIIPLALLGLAVVQTFGGPSLETALQGADQFLSPAAVEVIEGSLADSHGSGGASAASLLILAWSASKIFRGLDVAFSAVDGVAVEKSLPGRLLNAAIVFLSISVALAASALLGVVIPYIEWIPFAGVLSQLSLPGVLTIAFFPMFYRFPDIDIRPRQALPGTIFAAIGWALLATGFSIYATYAGNFQLYGVLGAGLLLVSWLYLGGIIIMVGAVVNVVLVGGPPGDRDGATAETDSERTEPAPDIGELAREVEGLRADLDEKTMSRSAIESELKAYVRKRQRKGKATGWGPYLVLLYGTAMTLGAFYWLQGGWAILAMIVVWLSTLGLYVQLVLFGMGIQAASVPGRLLEVLRNARS